MPWLACHPLLGSSLGRGRFHSSSTCSGFEPGLCLYGSQFLRVSTDEIETSQSSSIVEFWLLVFPFLFFSILSGFPNLGPVSHRVTVPHISFGGFSFNCVSIVNPFQESDKLRFPSTLHQSSIRFSCNTSIFEKAALVTSM